MKNLIGDVDKIAIGIYSTVDQLKAKLCRTRSAQEKRTVLMFDDIHLDGGATLSSYNITDNSEVHVLEIPYSHILIKVQISSKVVTSVLLCRSDSIETLKLCIYRHLFIPISQQSLNAP